MPPSDDFLAFGLVTAFVCIPTYLLIGILNSHTGQSSLLTLFTKLTSLKSDDTPRPLQHRVRSDIGTTPIPSPNPSTQRRLSRSLATYEGFGSRSAHASTHPAVLESRELRRTFSDPPPQQPQSQRLNTVKFNLRSFDTTNQQLRRSATAIDVSEKELSAIKPSNTDPGPRSGISRRGKTLFRGITERFTKDEKKESPV